MNYLIDDLKVVRVKDVKLPVRGTSKSAGIDFFVPNDTFPITLDVGERVVIPSGIHVKIPEGHYLQANNKSGVSVKKGLTYGAGVIDEDYQGEIGIVLVNTSNQKVSILAGEKIVQFILTPVPYVGVQELNSLEELYPEKSERGAGAYGHTGDGLEESK